jgi:hypothetical protein
MQFYRVTVSFEAVAMKRQMHLGLFILGAGST